MAIDPGRDVLVYLALVLFLGMLGARAWVRETGHRQFGGTPAEVRALSIGTGVTGALLVGLVFLQGGAVMVEALLTGTDPIAILGGADPQDGQGGQPGVGGDPAAPADPAQAPGGTGGG